VPGSVWPVIRHRDAVGYNGQNNRRQCCLAAVIEKRLYLISYSSTISILLFKLIEICTYIHNILTNMHRKHDTALQLNDVHSTRIINDDSEVAVLWLVQTAAQAIMWLATLLTPVVFGRKYVALNPVAGTLNQK